MPTLRLERKLLREGAVLVAGIDEVGRGALAGPVMVGAVVVDASTPAAPPGTNDSKLVGAAKRAALVGPLREWAAAWAVGRAEAAEVDEVGVVGALRRAAMRALAALDCREPDVVILDGIHDWLSPVNLLDQDLVHARVVTRAKADRDCASVAAASILAKTERDAVMASLAAAHPEFGWQDNKGYGSPQHLDSLARLGPTPLHRRSWRLP